MLIEVQLGVIRDAEKELLYLGWKLQVGIKRLINNIYIYI